MTPCCSARKGERLWLVSRGSHWRQVTGSSKSLQSRVNVCLAVVWLQCYISWSGIPVHDQLLGWLKSYLLLLLILCPHLSSPFPKVESYLTLGWSTCHVSLIEWRDLSVCWSWEEGVKAFVYHQMSVPRLPAQLAEWYHCSYLLLW